MPKVAIIGAGIIGLSCAWELAKRGADVTVYEKNWPPRGASWAAAGMLAPAYEAAAEDDVHPRLFDLCMESAALWPRYAAELEAASGMDVGYHPGPSLAVATDTGQAKRIVAIRNALDARGVVYRQLSADEARAMEPALSEEILDALLLPSDGWAENRLTLEALIKVCGQVGVSFQQETARVTVSHAGVLQEDHDEILVCAGWESAIVPTLMGDEAGKLVNVDTIVDEVDCYGGQMVSVRAAGKVPSCVLRFGDEYMVPRVDRVVIGATVEPGISRRGATDDLADGLIRRAGDVWPGANLAEVVERWSGTRPGTDDKAPLLGRLSGKGVSIASGHYRNGILLAPITAKIMADMILDDEIGELAAAFTPHRFEAATR